MCINYQYHCTTSPLELKLQIPRYQQAPCDDNNSEDAGNDVLTCVNMSDECWSAVGRSMQCPRCHLHLWQVKLAHHRLTTT